jgi:LysM repeat protein
MKHHDKTSTSLAVASGIVTIVAIAGISYGTFAHIASAETAYADSSLQSQMQMIGEYKDALDAYKLLKGVESSEETPGVVVPANQGDTQKLMESVEAAGLDPNNIIQDMDGTSVYLIQPGDTLSQISAAFGYSVDKLANLNEIRNVNLIYANSALQIPKD